MPDAGETGETECAAPSANDQLYLMPGKGRDLPYHIVYEFAVIKDPDANDIIPLTPNNYISSGANTLKAAVPVVPIGR